MNNYKLEKDEVILFEGKVIAEEIKSEVKLTLTSKKMIFEKEKGIIKKKLKVIDTISLINIKTYKEDIQIKREKANIIIQTVDKNITLSCSNAFEAKKIIEKIISIKTGSSIMKRTGNKVKNTIGTVGKAVAGTAVVVKMGYEIAKNAGEIAKTVKNIFKRK
jgi:hypothetical protein